MVLRWLFRHLANNDKLVNHLAESYPVRRAAQLSVYLFTIGRSAVANPRVGQLTGRLEAQLKEIAEELKKKASKQ